MNGNLCAGVQCPECYQIPLNLRIKLIQIEAKIDSIRQDSIKERSTKQSYVTHSNMDED